MARYERDYGRDFGRWRQNQQLGGMRSDGWGGSGDWRQFAGEDGWYGEGQEGMPGRGYDANFRGDEFSSWRSGRSGGFGGRFGSQGGDFQQGYGRDFNQRGGEFGFTGRNWDTGQGGRETGYSEGWENPRGRNRGRFGRGGERIQTRAAEIMTEDPQSVTPDATLSEVAQKMRDLDVGIIPVVDSPDSRRLRGVITDRDIAIRAVAEGKDGSAKVSDCMTAQVRAVNKNDSVQDVMRVMQQDQIRRVPVTDREGRLVGIIAQADLAVDYGSEDPRREMEVGETLQRISEPASPTTREARSQMSRQDQQDRSSNRTTVAARGKSSLGDEQR